MMQLAERQRIKVPQPSRDARFKKIIAFLCGAVVLVFCVFAYWWFAQADKIVALRVGTGSVGSDTHVLMREINEVAARHGKPLFLELTETHDPSEAVSLLNKGEVDLALIRSNTPVASDTRMIANIFAEYFQLVVAADTSVYGVNDITQIKLMIPPFGTDGFLAFWSLVDHYDLDIKAGYWQAKPFDEAKEAFLRGDVDGIFTLSSIRDPGLLLLVEDAELKRKALRYIPINQARAMALKRPFLGDGLIPQGSFGGQGPLPKQDLKTVSVERVLVTKQNADAGAVRALTEVLFENRLDLTIRKPLSHAIRTPDIDGGLSIPLHEGAAQFYNRDEPSFIQENAEPLALGVTLIAMMISGLFALRARFNARQKNRADVYNYQLLDMISRAREATNVQQLTDIKTELTGILETIVVALDTDEITDEGFQSFALICEQVQSSLRDRRVELIEG